MAKLVTIENSNKEKINIADIKADTIKQILALASICNKIDYI